MDEVQILGECTEQKIMVTIKKGRGNLDSGQSHDPKIVDLEEEGIQATILRSIAEEGVEILQTIGHTHKNLLANREFILYAVKLDGNALKFANKRLRADREIVREAANQNEKAFAHSDNRLRMDRDFVLEVVKNQGMSI